MYDIVIMSAGNAENKSILRGLIMTKEKFIEAMEILTQANNRASKIEVSSSNGKYEIVALSLTPAIIEKLQKNGFCLNLEEGKMFICHF